MTRSSPVICIKVSKCMMWKERKQMVKPSLKVPTIRELPIPTRILKSRMSPERLRFYISVKSSRRLGKFQSIMIFASLSSIRNAFTLSDFIVSNVILPLWTMKSKLSDCSLTSSFFVVKLCFFPLMMSKNCALCF